MANAFTTTKSRRYAGPVGKSVLRVEGSLVIDTTANGGAAKGDLPAALFGLTEISACSSIVNDNESKVYPAAPAYDGSSLMVGGGTAGAPSDLPNDTYFLVIEGIN